MTRLPPPEEWVIQRMNEMELAEEIERHIDYVDKEGRSVRLPILFVRHYLQRRDSKLPSRVAVSPLPLVLADGALLAPEGLDRLRGIEFVIPKELRAIIPAAADCTPKAVGEAMTFLCDEWLIDVKTNIVGKCTVIASALTLIERSLLADRPVFFISAGRRGGGKTTTIIMIIMAVTGVRPAASAWSTNEEERRKALLSYFMYNKAYILWDNIPRGSQIDCPHIEKSCTSKYYADRRLGVSEIIATAASTIHLFTGNNIMPRGDLSSRSLRVNIEVDRPDPENREFKHPDIIGWTTDHRAEILAALYTVLLGNPELKQPRDAPAKTRFKMWWRLIGSAVEHAAGLIGRELDFQKLFAEQEGDDEDDMSLADVLDIFSRWPSSFTAAEVASFVNDDSLDEDGRRVREYLLPGVQPGQRLSSISIGRLLRKHLDEPVKCGDRTLALRKAKHPHTKTSCYYVHIS
jgi:hypothetical protein